MKRIGFRTSGGEAIGYGHLYRCLSLAKAMNNQSKNFEIIFIINDNIKSIITEHGFEYKISNSFENDYEVIKEMDFDLIVVDTYNADNFYLKTIKKESMLMLFDDNNDIYDSEIPDILLNGNIHAKQLNYNTNGSTHFLLGTMYLVMRENYWRKSTKKSTKKSGVLITTGGSDTYNISPKILKALDNTNYNKKVIIGPGYSEETIRELNEIKDSKTEIIMKPDGLKKYIEGSEFVITASGSTVYEVIAQKTIPIIFTLAENQNIVYDFFKKAGIQTIGKYPNINYDKITCAIKKSQKIDINKYYSKIDGKGAIRVAQEIIKYLKTI